MGKLRAKARNALKASSFGLPGERKYPMPDRAHAANAKARASQQLERGHITQSQKAQIDRKADAKLHAGKFAHHPPRLRADDLP